MMRKLDGMVLGMAVIMAAACGGDEKGKDGHASVGGDVGRYIKALCTKMVECGGVFDGTTVDQCIDAYGLLLTCGTDLEKAKLNGIDECVHAIDELACDEAVGEPDSEACAPLGDDIMRAQGYPIAKIGEGCNQEWAAGAPQCTYAAYCSGGEGQCGTCVARKDDGEACTSFEECKSHECRSDGKCGQYLKTGEACGDDVAGDCVESCIDGKCAPFPNPKGQACETHADCKTEDDDEYRCDKGKCADLLPPGGACTSNDECEIGCENGQCANTSACGQGDVGDHCYGGWSEGQCMTGLFCDWHTDSCQELVKLGGTCVEFGCAEGTFCDITNAGDVPRDEETGICTKAKGNGEFCGYNGECQSGLCDFNSERCVDIDQCDGDARKHERVQHAVRKRVNVKRERNTPRALKALRSTRPAR
jgi:hypothetical protein